MKEKIPKYGVTFLHTLGMALFIKFKTIFVFRMAI